jgi:CRP-like cAMP-binding protein
MSLGISPVARQIEEAKPNRFLAALPVAERSALEPHLRQVVLPRGAILHDSGDPLEHVYFPQSGMVSLVAVMQNGATIETGCLGRSGVVGATAGLGSRTAFGRAVVQLPGRAAQLSAAQLRAAAKQGTLIHDLLVRYNDLLIAQIQQSVACNALHSLDARLCRWLLQTHDCVDGNALPVTQEFLGQMLGVRRTTVTLAARLLASAGLIRYRRGLFHVRDRAALEQQACECYGMIRFQSEKVFPREAF